MMSDERLDGVAIIGMTGRFPGAESVEEFWDNLIAGKESISFFSDAELIESGLNPSDVRRQGRYVPARGLLKDADCFDAAFFSVHPKEAEVIDPQQRVFLEACWAALEQAGYPPGHMGCPVGVFGGATYNTYYQYVLAGRPDLIELVGSDLVMFGNEKDYLTTRVAYKLGLKGPALNVCTACSTSLVAVAQACQSLLTYQCDIALAGGVSIKVPQKSGYYHDEGNIGSADGHTRPFDAQSSGTAFSNGVAVVVLKRMEDAIKNGDRVYAVIKSAALNNDGSQRVSFGAPGVEGQSEVIAMAHAMAGVDPETITCVEAHGTATPLGDPIEVAALTKAFRLGTQAKQFCALGSVKSNIGHLDAAAGVAGFIKMALSLHHKMLPPSLHFTKPNPKLDIENSPFYVNAALQKWTTKPGVPRRGGISSFGSGGTNAHVILEEVPELPSSGPSRPWQLLVFSGKTPEALDRVTSNLVDRLKLIADPGKGDLSARELADAAFTLQTGRSAFAHRRIVACSDASDGVAALEARDPKRVFTHRQQLSEPPVVFMFPGQGAQYPGMGAALYRTESVFRSEVDRCAELLQPILQADIRRIMFPSEGRETESDALLVQTRFTQPALFVIEYASAKLWMSWGIKPAAMIGHSVGEYVAGCLAGVFSPEDALMVVARRGALVQAQPGGAMLAVRLPEHDVLPLLSKEMSIAAVNSPNLCVAAGPYGAISTLEKELEAKGVTVRHLHTSHAFHSPMMEPVLEPFTSLFKTVKLSAPTIPYVSNVSAKWITAADAQSPDYWAGHVRQTVRFADGVAELLKDPRQVLLEVGPGQTLCTLARQHPDKKAEQAVFASLPLVGNLEVRGITETLGRLWMTGVTIDWSTYYSHEQRCRAVLPTYPFERKRYWPDQPAHMPAPSSGMVSAPFPAVNKNGSDPAVLNASPLIQAPPSVQSTVAGTAIPRKERLLGEARRLMQDLSGYDLSSVEPSTDLLELGFDSLLVTQAALLIQRKFGVPLSFRQLMEDISSLDAIASHLDVSMPAETCSPEAVIPAVATSSPPLVTQGATTAAAIPQSVLERILQQQQELTNQVLHLMRQQPGSAPAPEPTVPVSTTPVQAAPSVPATTTGKSHGPFKPFDKHAGMSLTEKQKRALEALIERYTRKTGGSKRLAGENRATLADPRSVAGFSRLWKEMVYPIVTTRSAGSKVWDVDGNEYIDFVMGFGASLFGHRPPFVVDAMHKQLDIGFEIGPIQPLAYEVAALLKEFTGMPRCAFTSTGSEAILGATRMARTVTGRDKIAVFAGAYHGIFDEVLFRPLTVNGEMRTAAIAPGIPDSALAQVIVLDYGNPQSLDILRVRGHEIAAVLVEPVQSRRLDLQPREFLHELRRMTQETGTALVFDEVVMGFRLHPGGAQSYFGVRADLATYGKVIGGGMSIGVVAGDRKYIDALDGGQWQYGDAAFPEVGMTFFAGTFVRHPLALAAAKAVLMHLKESGPELQQRLAERTALLAGELRAVIAEFWAPYHLTQFSSLIQIGYPSEQKCAGLLFYLLRERGIHIFENRAFVLTTAHSDADLAKLVHAFRSSLSELYAKGFLPLSSEAQGRLAVTERVSRTDAAASTGKTPASMFPLTEAQKEIWLAAQMGGEASIAYNESLTLKFTGIFDASLFREAFYQVIRRHPILLASISEDGEWQRLPEVRTIEIPFVDLNGRSPVQQEQAVTGCVEQEAEEPFNLAAGPLMRVKIIMLSPEHHVVLFTAHHIVCDGWSGGVIIDELARIYSARKCGSDPLLETPVSFEDYAGTTETTNHTASGAVAYWKDQFAVLPPPLDLPTDRPRPLVRSAKAATVIRKFDLATTQALKRIAGQQRTTMVVLLMAAMKMLLHRLAGQSDFVLGLPVAGQAVTGNNCLVGHCVNLLPIRTQLEAEASFLDNLASVKKNVLDAYDHQQCTIGTILQHIKVPRSTSRPSLVEVIFNVDRDLTGTNFTGLSFECERNPKRALHYDLFFNFVEGARGLHVECDYNTDLFDAATLERWLGHYQTLLGGITAKSGEPISTLPILTETERNELLTGFNDSPIALPNYLRLHELFEHQTERNPEARAVTFEGGHLTYGELNRRANQVAHRLKALGAGPDVLVGLFLERSPEMLVGILGILKAGAAYVPMDPEYPKERLGYILYDSRAPIVVTQKSLVVDLPDVEGRLICLDGDWADIAREPEGNPLSDATGTNLAYVLFTSGSTGRPKGVAIEHHSAVTFVQWASRVFTRQELMGVLFSTSVCFDLSIYEIFVTLTAGGTIIIAPNALHLPRLSSKSDVTLINTVPSAITELLQMSGVPSSVKVVNLAGEVLSDVLVERIYAETKVEKVYNLYGPTEATTYSTYTLVPRGRPVTIGRPIANTQAYILDSHRCPVPRGVLGELYLAGEGLARGYYGRPDLTDERFVPNPFNAQLGARMYRTGDLCRWLPDTSIQYLGRLDHQIKLRGFRIELGEIEATLSRSAGVLQNLVMACEDQPGRTSLVAYVIPEAGTRVQIDDLRLHLKQSLPAFMVPSSIVVLDAFPLSPNGKIDRTRLPRPNELPADSACEYVAPRDHVEQMLAQVWAEVLRVRQVGRHDNFFDLGGHSLLAVRIIIEIEKLFKRRLPLATLIQAPTVGDLAEVLRKEQWTPSWSSLVPIRAGGSKPPLLLFHSHGGNVLEYYPLVALLDNDQPVYALQAKGLDGSILRNRSLEDMVRGYIEEIRCLQPKGPYYLGGFCFGGLAALEAARQLWSVGETVALVAMIQTTHPAVNRLACEAASMRQRRQRVIKRLDLELENFKNRGFDHIRAFARRALDIIVARLAIGLDQWLGRQHQDLTAKSTAYILEALSREHDKVYERYQPRSCGCPVVLFRTGKQIPGLTGNRSLGWQQLLDVNLEVCDVPGHQQNVLITPHAVVLAKSLMSRLKRAQELHTENKSEPLALRSMRRPSERAARP